MAGGLFYFRNYNFHFLLPVVTSLGDMQPERVLLLNDNTRFKLHLRRIRPPPILFDILHDRMSKKYPVLSSFDFRPVLQNSARHPNTPGLVGIRRRVHIDIHKPLLQYKGGVYILQLRDGNEDGNRVEMFPMQIQLVNTPSNT